MDTAARPVKRQRATKACDFCHARGRKCAPRSQQGSECATCADFGVACTWNRVAKRRGAKPQPGKGLARWILNDEKHGQREVIELLIDTYFQQVYPVVNVVFERSYREKWQARDTPNSQPSFALLMSICALSAFRFHDTGSLRRDHASSNINPDLYLEEALAAIPTEVPHMRTIEMLQAIGLICVTALERRMAPLLHKMFGTYHAALADQGFCDEKQWKADLSPIEREERRRLFWYMYRLEVHTSLVMGHVVRCPDLQSHVGYPTVRDEEITASGHMSEWLTGWNFVTDLYRGMEHLITRFRLSRSPQASEGRLVRTDFISNDHLAHQILEQVLSGYELLPDRFKNTSSFSDPRNERCAFQHANIVCTMLLVEMLALTANNATLLAACQTAHTLIDKISFIPPQFLRAMSLGMLQELSGFGQILSSFIGKDMSRSEYTKLRIVMLSMAELLENLDDSLASAGQAAQKLRNHVHDIDQFLQDRKQGRKPVPAEPPAVSPLLNQIPVVPVMTEADLDPMMSIPIEYFQEIPWPGAEWYGTEGLEGIYA
ncbi:hypothetical protein CAC42_3731 [Sphaceloma murrayae]|uniref:Zn(2)-C6 fungal-type domain-containing protein n=1 Tax=Sphaceloma murrayae TaxID=2082308 RepID=A0A2K1QH04_9PEZI|nr:hypothetical protein CAC42_3731 [Sphaceloma murrayae]